MLRGQNKRAGANRHAPSRYQFMSHGCDDAELHTPEALYVSPCTGPMIEDGARTRLHLKVMCILTDLQTL